MFIPHWKYGNIYLNWLYEDKSFKWLYNPRKFLSSGPDFANLCEDYSVFVYTGESKNIIHRIIYQELDFEYVTFSVSNTEMFDNMSTNLFFVSEKYLLKQTPWKEQIEIKTKELKERESTITLELNTAKKGKYSEQKFSRCVNYPK